MSQAAKEPTETPATEEAPQGITRITVSGFKSIADETSIDIKPLTILAGVNSSGKTSIMQPLLLMKQTLEATYDPGPLKLDGPNVWFTQAEQLFSGRTDGSRASRFAVRLEAPPGIGVSVSFVPDAQMGLALDETTLLDDGPTVLRPEMTPSEVGHAIRASPEGLPGRWPRTTVGEVYRDRCFLNVGFKPARSTKRRLVHAPYFLVPRLIASHVSALAHLPGLRGNPQRWYTRTGTGPHFPGTFENYAASVILHWQQQGDNRPSVLGGDLRRLGLTDRVEATALDDTRVQLDVARPPVATASAEGDMVSIADVGFGVSQVLPVLVALLAAEPGRLVYIEQPELHLHPKAQVALATVLADAAKRGVRVVAETHSPLLVLAVQALVAEDKLSPEDVALHWFTLNDEGITEVATADLDEAGRFGDWPADFDDVSLRADNRYLTAVETKMGLR